MRRSALTSTLLAALCTAPAGARAADLSFSVLGGYMEGPAVRVGASLTRIFPGSPLGVQLGAGFRWIDPGDPALARRVFINDATDGTPEKSGHVWDLRLDGLWSFRAARFEDVAVFAGLRRSSFTGRFRFVGGNEDFEVTTDQWGVGFGARAGLRVGQRLTLTGAIGLDWYPSASLYGHDTTYSSSGSSVNGRDGYGWADANRAIHQPDLVPSLLLGLSWKP